VFPISTSHQTHARSSPVRQDAVAEPSGDARVEGVGRTGSGGEDDRAGRMRSSRVAGTLESIDRVFDKLLADPGSGTFRAALGSLFDEVIDEFGADKLERLGLDAVQDATDLFTLDERERRAFVKALQQGDDTLEKVLLGGHSSREKGLIEGIRDLLKDEIASRNDGQRLGGLVDVYA